MAGNFSHATKTYLASPQFERLAPATQYNWKRALILAEGSLGPLAIDVIRPSIIQAHLDGLSDFPGKQEIAKTALKAVEKFALVRDLMPYPFTTGVQTIGSDGGHEPWTDEEVETAIREARPDIARAISLAINTGQRGSDIVKMRWSDIIEQDGRKGINITQQKTGKQLCIPLTHHFAEQIAEWEKRPPFFLVLAPDGRQFTRNRLSHDWTKERDTNPQLAAHKGRKLVLHGLRATAVVRFRRAGWSELEISSMVGMSEPMVTRYCRKANKNKLAMDAMNRLDNVKALQTKSLKSNDPTL